MTDPEIVRSYPLSPIQQGMLFHHLSDGHRGVDFEQIMCRFREHLDLAAFQRAWQSVADRHDALRTTFRWEELDEPRQEIHARVDLTLDVRDLRDRLPSEHERHVDAYLRQDRAAGFDLTKPPLLRLAVFQIGLEDHQFVISFPHILMDGRSLGIVLAEVFAYYEAFRRNEDLVLEPPSPYARHIDWLTQRDGSGDKPFGAPGSPASRLSRACRWR